MIFFEKHVREINIYHKNTFTSVTQVKVNEIFVYVLGFGWISNLTLTDKTWIVPCIVGISYFVNNEISQARYKRDFIDQGKTMH